MFFKEGMTDHPCSDPDPLELGRLVAFIDGDVLWRHPRIVDGNISSIGSVRTSECIPSRPFPAYVVASESRARYKFPPARLLSVADGAQ
jgi:hypothetical protein